MRKQGRLILLVSLIPLFGAFSEETVFAPFVSHLEAELKNGFIRLIWEDSPDVTGPVFIYRAAVPFPVSPLPPGVEVSYGDQSYVDEADRPGTFHYFVVSSDVWGRKYMIPIPYTNTVSVTVNESDTAFFLNGAGEAPEIPETTESTGNIVHSLRAEEDGGRIVLTFEGGGGSVVLYRSTRPIRGGEDLLQAVVAGRVSSPPFIDYPAPGIPYYYAVIPEEEMSSGLVPLSAGKNTTTEPVTARRERETAGLAPSGSAPDIRTLPLPPINTEGARSGLSPDTSSPPLSEEALRAARALAGPASRTVLFREPGVFVEDMEGASSPGADGLLSQIVRGPFSERKWEEAGEELRRFLSLPRPPAVEGRSRFYLGQVYYFTGKPRDALFEFLAARNTYPKETNPWIDAALARLAN
ncbi:MAG: hypothetical protein LBH35_08090 [Treponema sp.]|jgi:hypothetical protein|nr:hypothetical protein [Treponema sp.]